MTRNTKEPNKTFMSHRKTLKLSNLYLDLKNPRYEVQKSQSEALNTIAKEQGQKLLVLLKDIIEHGLNPTDIPIVMPDSSKNNAYVVLEGNRRIAALKLFKKPTILTNSIMRQKFSKLHDRHKKALPMTIECWVAESREEASLWIERKHEGEMNGAGTVRWDSVQKGRFLANNTGKDTRAMQLIDFMKSAAEGDDEFAEDLKKVSSTNIERLFGTPEVCSSLGLEYNQGEYTSRYEWSEVLKGLKAVVKRMSNNDFKVANIYHKSDRLKFIADMPLEELPDKARKAVDQWKLKDFVHVRPDTEQEGMDAGNQNKGNGQDKIRDGGVAQKERPTSRDTFLPVNFTLSVSNDRINRIYSELKLLSHNTMTNSCAVMLRVFLELSADCYLEQCGLLKDGVLSGSRSGDLKSKINMVIKHLCDKSYLDDAKAKGIRDEMNSKQGAYSIDTLNAYVHNLDFNPIPENLMLAWDNIQPFVVAMWKAINDQDNE